VGFSSLIRRRQGPALVFRLHDVCWGIKRRPGFSEIDDPGAHRSTMAHAYVSGNDSLALCGYKPYPRGRQPHVSLALATGDNPECSSCREAMPFALPLVVQPDVAGEVLAAPFQSVELPSPLQRIAYHLPSMAHRRNRRRQAALGPGAIHNGSRAASSRRRRRMTNPTRQVVPVAVPVLVEAAAAG
jgi:hypothetical protein